MSTSLRAVFMFSTQLVADGRTASAVERYAATAPRCVTSSCKYFDLAQGLQPVPMATDLLDIIAQVFEPAGGRIRLQGFEEAFRLVEAGQQFLGFVLREQFAFPERHTGLHDAAGSTPASPPSLPPPVGAAVPAPPCPG